MKQVTVYQIDYVRKTRVPIGWVVERRSKARADNLIGLVRLARKLYASDAQTAFRIVIDSREARLA